MTAILYIGALSIALGMAWLIHEALTAPYGWEDERGWHAGIEPGNEIHINHGDVND